MDAKYGNSEYWFGGSSYYVNFNIQLLNAVRMTPMGWCRQMIKEAEAYLLSMGSGGY